MKEEQPDKLLGWVWVGKEESRVIKIFGRRSWVNGGAGLLKLEGL